MLESLRSFVGGWVAKVLLVLLVGSFALWGISGSIFGTAYSNSVATVGETNVSIRDFITAYNQNMNAMQRQVGRRLSREEARIFGVENRTLSNVVSYAVIDEFAREQNLSLSDTTLAQMLAENRQFQDSTGKFNRDTFTRAVRDAQMRESDFIALQNASAVRSQVTESFATGDILPKVFANAMASYVAEERKFSYITVTREIAGPPPEPTSAQLKKWFDDNAKKYRAPEYRKIDLLVLEPKDIADEKSVTDEDVANDYETHKRAYEVPERRRVQQIVFKSQEEADAAVKSLAEGALFETVLSDNKLTISDADLGLIAKDKLPKALQDTAFAAEINKPSDLIKGPFGPTMIRVTEIVEAKVTPLAEVKDKIRKDIALLRAGNALIDTQETIEDARAGGTSLADIGKRMKLKTRTIEAVDRSGRKPDGTLITDIPESSKLLQQAFETPVGAQAAPTELGSTGYLWFDVASITEARDQTQEEVADKVKADLIADEQAKLVAAKADELKARLEKGEKLADIATEVGAEVKTTDLLKRNGEEQGFPAAATKAGFEGDTKKVSIVDSASAGEKMLITVAERKLPEAQAVESPEEQIKLANEGAADDLLSQMITNLQTKYTVTTNPALINQAITQGY